MTDAEGLWSRFQNRGAAPPRYGWDAFENSPYHTAKTRAGFIAGTVHPYRKGEGPSPRIASVKREPRLPREPPRTRRLLKSSEEADKKRTMGYFERRFGWASNFKVMWDTDPSGSVNAIKRVEPRDRGGTARRAVAHATSSGWDRDPATMQLVPAAGTCGTALRPHECWDNRGSSSWRQTCEKEVHGQLAALPRRPATTRAARVSFRPTPPPPAAAATTFDRSKFMDKPTKVLGVSGHYVHPSAGRAAAY